jgi:hypothetical protein
MQKKERAHAITPLDMKARISTDLRFCFISAVFMISHFVYDMIWHSVIKQALSVFLKWLAWQFLRIQMSSYLYYDLWRIVYQRISIFFLLFPSNLKQWQMATNQNKPGPRCHNKI